MKVSLTSRELEILRKKVDGSSEDEIAAEFKMSQSQVSRALKNVYSLTQSKDPLACLQTLARNGFEIRDTAD